MTSSLRIGSGIDVHAFAPPAQQRPLVLGGVTIPDHPGLLGHSDADVVAHAVADAVLGASGLGDLGTVFGVDEPTLAGASSLDLLRRVARDAGAAGWRPVNVDATVVAERPRLGDRVREMAANLADALGLAPPEVSVKATSTDGVGAIGGGEGIMCVAACLLTR